MDTIRRYITSKRRKIFWIYRNRHYRKGWRKSSKTGRRSSFTIWRGYLSEQVAFLRAENRLLVNYLRWYETRILHHTDYPKQHPTSSPPKSRFDGNTSLRRKSSRSSDEELLSSDRTSRHLNPTTLSIQKKRDIAETTCRILLAYSQKYSNTTSDYVDQCLVIRHTEIFSWLSFQCRCRIPSQRMTIH